MLLSFLIPECSTSVCNYRTPKYLVIIMFTNLQDVSVILHSPPMWSTYSNLGFSPRSLVPFYPYLRWFVSLFYSLNLFIGNSHLFLFPTMNFSMPSYCSISPTNWHLIFVICFHIFNPYLPIYKTVAVNSQLELWNYLP